LFLSSEFSVLTSGCGVIQQPVKSSLPEAITSMGAFARIADTEGNVIGLFESA
jgi:predicted enzyme related to lactoylglutathione lyase